MRDSVKWFADAMETKLQQNEDKPGWDNENFYYLVAKLAEHVHRVNLAAHVLQKGIDRKEVPALEDIASVVELSANIGNYAMMLADNAHRLTVYHED